MKILSEPQDSLITPSQLQDGQIAIIEKWPSKGYKGKAIIKFEASGKLNLISIGEPESYWNDILNCKWYYDGTALLKVLKKGTVVEI